MTYCNLIEIVKKVAIATLRGLGQRPIVRRKLCKQFPSR